MTLPQPGQKAAQPGAPRNRIKFGAVEVWAAKVPAAAVKEKAQQSNTALEQALQKIIQPGVRLTRKRGIAFFSVDPADPAVILRQLDGKVERGRLEDGEFREIA